MDKINIEQLEVFAYHGCKEEEKQNGQNFYVDATLFCDITEAGSTDELDDTVNYSKVCKYINKFMTENRFDLIEAVAEQTAMGILHEFPKIRGVEITINKPNAPIKLPFGNVSVTAKREWTKAYLSIGSNMGDKEANLNQAIDSLYDDPNCRVLAMSKFIETEPYGPVEQDNFLNGCLEIETLYTPQELLAAVNEIEDEAGRTREVHWGPRTLDIDIIFFGDEIVKEQNLMIPHIEMHKRLFVLEPLVEIAPYMIHPVFNKSVMEMKNELKPNSACEGCGGCPMTKEE